MYPRTLDGTNEMVEIIPGVHQIEGVNANCYVVVENDGSLTLIDTGMAKDGKKILNYVQEEMGKKPSEIKTIVLTHNHFDHVRGAFEIKRATQARLAIHELDADYLSGTKKMAPPKGGIGVLFRILGPFFRFTAVDPDLKLNESENNRVGGSLKVVHTPGHTPGSISLYDENRRLIFVGDTIRYRNGKLEGPPKSFTLDMKQAVASVEKISNLNFDVMLSGHGQPLKSPDASQKVRQLSKSLG